MQKSTHNALELHNLSVAYHNQPVLLNVHASVPVGALCAFVGPNGAGKTTLLKTMLGLVTPLAGYARILGQPFAQVADRVAYIPQRTSVDWDFPATVFDVVMMGRYRAIGWCKWPRTQDKDAVWEALAHVGMADYAQRPIGLLSGGQQQRVFLARALVQNADVYCMDEPFAGVDIATEQTIITLLKELCAQGKTVIVVHHDLQTLCSYFNWALLLNRTAIACGPVDQVVTDSYVQATYGRADMCVPRAPQKGV